MVYMVMKSETSVTSKPTKYPFDWSGGHPALDFVNTLDERPLPAPIERLKTYADFVRFTELAGIISPTQARSLRKLSGPSLAAVARRARKLREDIFETLAARNRRKAIEPAVLRGIASAIRDAHAARTLTASGGHAIARHDWASPHAPVMPLHACALAIEDLLTGADAALVRKCGARDCDVYFIDRSKGRRRHWCSMTNCGNREKQRRWRAESE
jgi:predicted RNA-binding Zn ribbon-like protein